MTDKMTADEAKTIIAQIIEECVKIYAGSFREVCVGIEAGLKSLMSKKAYVTRFKLDFFQQGVQLSELDITHKKPTDYNVDGIWTVIYAAITPRYTPFGPDPLRVTSLEIGYGMDPRVSYDASHENGLPMALNRTYDPAIIASKQQQFQQEMAKM